MKRKTNMYPLSVKQWNPFVGCHHQCVYCVTSFQRQLKRWAKTNCRKCYNYEPHVHPNRLSQQLPKTGCMQFIFTVSSGDIAWAKSSIWYQILDRIRNEPYKTFLLQSKNPKVFQMWERRIPDNVILGTTIETNKEVLINKPLYDDMPTTYTEISRAPHPSTRIEMFEQIKHKPKMLTFEPILNFDTFDMVTYAERIKPSMIWLGYDSKPHENKLPEPPLSKVQELHWELSKRGFTVILKTIRNAWWET